MHENKIYFLFIHTQPCQQNFRCCFQIRLEKASSYDLLLLCDFCIMEFAFCAFQALSELKKFSMKNCENEIFFFAQLLPFISRNSEWGRKIQMSVAGVSFGYVFRKCKELWKRNECWFGFLFPFPRVMADRVLAVT